MEATGAGAMGAASGAARAAAAAARASGAVDGDGPLTLDRLPMGCTGTVLSLGQDGAERRRLLAVGFVPGARVTAHRRSPLGDPIAYRVRGGTVALRREQARLITVVAGDGEGAEDADAEAAAGGAA